MFEGEGMCCGGEGVVYCGGDSCWGEMRVKWSCGVCIALGFTDGRMYAVCSALSCSGAMGYCGVNACCGKISGWWVIELVDINGVTCGNIVVELVDNEGCEGSVVKGVEGSS